MLEDITEPHVTNQLLDLNNVNMEMFEKDTLQVASAEKSEQLKCVVSG